MHVARAGGVNAYAPHVDEPISRSARFDELLAGIEAEVEAADVASLDADIAEVERAARSEARLIDRLRAQDHAGIELADGSMLAGIVVAVGRDVVVVSCDDGDWVIPAWGITAVINPREGTQAARFASERLGLASVLRAWARQRNVVRVVRIGAAPLDGTIDAVGADHLDLAEHDPGEPRTSAAVRRQAVIPFGAIAGVRRR